MKIVKKSAAVFLILTLALSGTVFAVKNRGYKFPVPNYTRITTYYSSSHPGIDIAANLVSDVYAVRSGRVLVKYTGCNNYSRGHGKCRYGGVCNPNHGYSKGSYSFDYCNDGTGNGYIIQNDDGTRSLYAHMNYLPDNIQEGSYVSQGDYLGGVSSTGNSSGPHLHFELRLDNNSNYWRATAVNPFDYMDVDDQGTAVYESNSVNISNGVYTLSPKNAPSMVLDISGGTSNSEANVQIWKSNGTNAQKFSISGSGSSYILTALCGDKVLDVCGGSGNPGTNLWQYESNGTISQKWSFIDAGDGYYYIKSNLGTYIDVENGASSSGTNVWMWKFNGSDAQKWKLTPTSGVQSNTYTAYVANTPGNDSLAINSRPAAGNKIGEIPYGGAVTVYPDKTSGNWLWVSYNGISGYSYSKYLASSSQPAYSSNTRTGVVTGTGGRTLAINSRPAKGYQIGAIPEGASMTVYPDKTSGNWYWVSYNGVSGYSYKGYITLR